MTYQAIPERAGQPEDLPQVNGRDGVAVADPPERPKPERPASRGAGAGESRLRALDGMRIIAALMVCVYHYSGRTGTISESWNADPHELFPGLSQVSIYGNLGVEFFFVISGFVICMSSWGRSLGQFFRSRVARLYPAYWVAILMVTAAAIAMPVVVKPLRIDEFLVNLTMLQQPVGSERVLGVCWTLWVELRFYLLFALFVVWKGVTYRRCVIFSCLWLIAGVFAQFADDKLLSEITVADYAPFFVGGLALYLIHRYGSDLLLWGLVVVSFLLGQRYALVLNWNDGPPPPSGIPTREPWGILLLVALAYICVAVVALGWLNWANWRWLTIAGALTYPFYLIHEHLGWFAVRIFRQDLGFSPYLTLFSSILLMLTLAWLMHRLVERPGGRLLKQVMTEQAKALGTRLKAPANS